jgi:hypothetical protein
MAVRIQFRRGTAAEWTSANPVMAAGELGYETDTAKTKVGDGSTVWTALVYAGVNQADIEAAVANVVAFAPGTLDTLNELAAAIGDDDSFVDTVAANIATAEGNAASYSDDAVSTHSGTTTSIHGIPDTSILETTTGSQSKANAAQANAQSYADSAISSLVDSSPGTLDTLNELAAALGDDPNFATTISGNIATKLTFEADTTANFVSANALSSASVIYLETDNGDSVRIGDGVLNYNDLLPIGKTYTDNTVGLHGITTTSVHGIVDTSDLVYTVTTNTIASELTAHEALEGTVHGIADSSLLVYQNTITNVYATFNTHDTATTNVHGITDTALLATTDDLAVYALLEAPTLGNAIITTAATLPAATTIGTVTADELSYVGGVTSAIQGQLSTLDSEKASTAGPTFSGTVVLPSTTSIGTVSDAEIAYLDGVTGGIQTQIDTKLSSAVAASTYAPLASPTFTGTVVLPADTSIDGVSATEISYLGTVTSDVQVQIDTKAPTADPTFTGTVAGITKAMVGLGNVNNTADANKPVSNSTQTALDLKADLAAANFVGNVEVGGSLVVDGDFTVNGANFVNSATSITIEDNIVLLASGNAGNVVDLGLVVLYNDGVEKRSGLVRDVSDDTWKLFDGVTSAAGTTVAFAEGSLDNLAVNNITAAGVVFPDGTQTGAGVVSITSFSEKTASYQLDTLSHKDNVVEMNSASAVTFTIPLEATTSWPVGASMDIIQTGAGQVTVAIEAGGTLNYTPGNKLRTQWSSCTIMKRSADSWILFGDLTA